MAIRVNRPKYREAFGKMGLTQTATDELLDAVEDDAGNVVSELATKGDFAALEHRIDAKFDVVRADIATGHANLEASLHRGLLLVFIAMVTVTALAVTLVVLLD